MSDATPAAGAAREVLITRIFDAPRERVFRAWTDPDEVAAWFGPEHFDTPRERIRIDLRVGGRFHDHGAKTRMTLSDSPHPSEGRGRAAAGWRAAFDKLAALVAG